MIRYGHRRRFGLALFLGIALTGLCAVAGPAQELRVQEGKPAEHGEATRAKQDTNVLGQIGDWFDRQFSNMKSDMKSAKENFDRDTDRATKKTWETAKDAADAVARLPEQRTVRGRERCPVAPNGAPDCETAAGNLCRTKGFGSGKSIDATTAETCPPQVLLSGRAPAPGECKTETFISRAICSP